MLRIGFVPVAEMKIFPISAKSARSKSRKIELLSLNNNEQMR